MKLAKLYTYEYDKNGKSYYFKCFRIEEIEKERESIAQDVQDCMGDIAFILQTATFINESDALRLKGVERRLETLEALLRAGDTASPLQPRGGEGTSEFKKEQVLEGERREEPALPKKRKLNAGSEGTT